MHGTAMKPDNCPCCGGEAKVSKSGTYGIVRCVAENEGFFAKGCGLRLESSEGVEEAIKRWNLRTQTKLF